MSGNDLARKHLLLRLRPIHRGLHDAARRQAEKAARLDRPDLAPLCVTDQHVAEHLRDVDTFIQAATDISSGEGLSLTDEERRAEQQLREQARTQGKQLPLDVMAATLRLAPYEIDGLLICAAPELDHGYERIFGYILDDLTRRFPCVELICLLASRTVQKRIRIRRELGPWGRMRRCGLLETFDDSTTGLRTQLRLGRGVLEFLLGSSSGVAGLWRDPAEIDTAGEAADSPESHNERVQRIGEALAEETIGVVGLWGTSENDLEDIAGAIARVAGKPLRRFTQASSQAQPANSADDVRTAVHTAAALDAILLVPADSLHDVENRPLADAFTQQLALCDLPVLLAGVVPWRPTELLSVRTYAEIHLSRPGYSTRQKRWSHAIPEINGQYVRDLAGRYRMSGHEIRAVGQIARSQARVESNGRPAAVEDYVDAACMTVARKTSGRFLGAVQPRRGPDDLILPAELHWQVLEIANFTHVLPQVAETWGFGRLGTGGTGMKCLFTGDPGTGKTLAAEVIAHRLGTPLLRINIAETVSKWVGETEKNLDAAFREAVASHAVLFFDEADALFGKRGEVKHGVDRYANLEVSHLLQRLEDHDGLVILASNLKENIDPAFTRRFHVVIHFPRPELSDRRRIWKIAFPPEAPLDAQVDLSSLARLDMTGAAIVGAARTAALLAAGEEGEKITMTHVVRGVARQFRREARILSTADLGLHASLLQEQS